MSRNGVHQAQESAAPKVSKVKEQQLLFLYDGTLPDEMPCRHELRPCRNLSAVFDECHNYVYANEGLLKDKIFHEMVKLLVMKLHDEQDTAASVQFGITAREYREVLEGRAGTFEARMSALFALVRQEYDTLISETALKLAPLTLAYVVGRLQFVSLKDTPGDVKGEAFQAFTYRHQRGGRGEFFTPHPVVRLAVEMVAPQPGEKIIDPACGSGGFLLQSLNHALAAFPETDKAEYVRQCIRGIEFNPDVALSASIRLAFEGGTGAEITCANALIEDKSLDGTFDIILTNPPFGNKGKVEDQKILKSYVLARKWNRVGESAWSPTGHVLPGQSPDVLFIEKCLRLLRPGGRMAIVLPDGLLHNVSSGHIRNWATGQAEVLGVVSIPQEAFVPYGTGIKTSLLLMQKRPVETTRPCFAALMQKMGYDVKGQTVYQRDTYGRSLQAADGSLLVDDDVDEIAAAFRCLMAGHPIQSETLFSVPRPLFGLRWDAEHYLPDTLKDIQRLQSLGARSLGEIAELVEGADAFRSNAGDEIRYIAISDVDYRTMQVVFQQTLTAHEAPSRATYRVRTGDIITATSGASTGTPRQATALITEDEDGAICSNGFAVLRNVHGVDPLFLLAYMRTGHYLRQVRRLMTGHAIPSISSDDMRQVLVPVPPQSEQKKIAAAVASIQAMRREAMRAGEAVAAQTNRLISLM